MLPPTIVNVLLATRLKESVPFTVVVLAIAVEMSTVTVVPAAITTGVQLEGTTPTSQVSGALQELEAMLVIVLQKTPPQLISAVAGFSEASPAAAPE
jgi:hypothetical protein